MIPEIQALLDKAKENLKAANLLHQNDYTDIAASRAYYAMFYVAEALLLSRGLTFSSHAAVLSAYGREFAKTGVLEPRFHRYLLDTQDLRQSGDYSTSPTVTREQMDQVLQWAQEFIAAAEAFLHV